jgi:hypothetical protein
MSSPCSSRTGPAVPEIRWTFSESFPVPAAPQRLVEPAQQQGAFAQLLRDGVGRLGVGDTGERAQRAQPAHGGRPAGQRMAADPGGAASGAHAPGEREQQSAPAGAGGPLDDDQ